MRAFAKRSNRVCFTDEEAAGSEAQIASACRPQIAIPDEVCRVRGEADTQALQSRVITMLQGACHKMPRAERCRHGASSMHSSDLRMRGFIGADHGRSGRECRPRSKRYPPGRCFGAERHSRRSAQPARQCPVLHREIASPGAPIRRPMPNPSSNAGVRT